MRLGQSHAPDGVKSVLSGLPMAARSRDARYLRSCSVPGQRQRVASCFSDMAIPAARAPSSTFAHYVGEGWFSRFQIFVRFRWVVIHGGYCLPLALRNIRNAPCQRLSLAMAASASSSATCA